VRVKVLSEQLVILASKYRALSKEQSIPILTSYFVLAGTDRVRTHDLLITSLEIYHWANATAFRDNSNVWVSLLNKTLEVEQYNFDSIYWLMMLTNISGRIAIHRNNVSNACSNFRSPTCIYAIMHFPYLYMDISEIPNQKIIRTKGICIHLKRERERERERTS
jgi:hypothetical protein